MSDTVIVAVLTPAVTALIAAVAALWRRSIAQRDESVRVREENAGFKADLRAAHQDIAELKQQLQERVLSEEYLLSYIEALEAVLREHNIVLPQRPRLRRIVQRSTQTPDEALPAKGVTS